MSSTIVSSEITTRPHLVEYTRRFVQPPGNLYLDPDDSLWIHLTSSGVPATFQIGLRILSPDGTVTYWRQEVIADTARFPVIDTFPLMEGFLLGLSVIVLATPNPEDWAHGAIGLTRSPDGFGNVSQVLARGYFTAFEPLLWPGGTNEFASQGRGFLFLEQGADPGAGADFSFTIPTGAIRKLLALNVELVTSAAAGNRRFILEVRRSGVLMFSTASVLVQTASLTLQYIVGHWGESIDAGNGRILVNWPEGIRLLSGDTITSAVNGLQAGDDFGAPSLYAEEWFAL